MIIVYFIFIFSLLSILYAYFGYPVSLYLIASFRTCIVKRRNIYPEVTIIITAYNEESKIEDKIRNTLRLEYPKDRLQILVVSDGSTDRTNDFVHNFLSQKVELLALETRCGKEYAQKRAIEIAKGDILVFSDVATYLDPDGLVEIVSNFADDSVGCVSSVDRLLNKKGGSSGEGLYVKYEMWLRHFESRSCSLVGMSGSFFAARKEVFYDFSGEMPSDFRTVLNSIKLGMRGVSDPKAIGYYLDVQEGGKEFERKVRTVIRGLTVFFSHKEFLNPLAYGLFAYQYFCHKLLRWLVPFFLIIFFVTNVVLAWSSLFLFMVLIFHCGFYMFAIIGWFRPSLRRKIYVKIPFYFSIVNYSILIAWALFIKGERIVKWQPTTR
jgi:glycosyltransferase involved in cell wall biosynthesis